MRELIETTINILLNEISTSYTWTEIDAKHGFAEFQSKAGNNYICRIRGGFDPRTHSVDINLINDRNNQELVLPKEEQEVYDIVNNIMIEYAKKYQSNILSMTVPPSRNPQAKKMQYNIAKKWPLSNWTAYQYKDPYNKDKYILVNDSKVDDKLLAGIIGQKGIMGSQKEI